MSNDNEENPLPPRRKKSSKKVKSKASRSVSPAVNNLGRRRSSRSSSRGRPGDSGSSGNNKSSRQKSTSPGRQKSSKSPIRQQTSKSPSSRQQQQQKSSSRTTSTSRSPSRGISPVIMKGLRKLRSVTTRSQSPGAGRRSQSPGAGRESQRAPIPVPAQQQQPTRMPSRLPMGGGGRTGTGTGGGEAPQAQSPPPNTGTKNGKRADIDNSNSSDQPPSKPKRRSLMGRLRDEQYVKPSRPSSRHVKDADLVKPRVLRVPSITGVKDDDSGEKAAAPAPAQVVTASRPSRTRSAAAPPEEYTIQDVPAAPAPAQVVTASRPSKIRSAPAPPKEYTIQDSPSRGSYFSSVSHIDPESIFKPSPVKPSSMPSISSNEDEGDDATPKPGSAPRLFNNSRPNLNRKSLESVKELKNSIKLMRVNRRKVKFSESTHRESTDVGAEPTNNPLSNSNTSLDYNQNSFTTLGSSGSSKQSQQQDNNTAFSPRLPVGVGLTMQDLEMMGSVKQSRQQNNQNQPQDSKLASLQQKVKKTKKLVKRTSRDVWAERDEIVNLQRTNWSIRKTLVQTDAPRDSVTSFNLSIAKLVRQERELDLSIDQMREEKQLLESECVPLRKSIDNFNELLHQLNAQILPLLPNSDDDDDEQPPRRGGFGFGIHPISMVVPSPAMTIEDSLSDSIHSTEEVEDKHLRQQQNNANATSQNARNNSRILSPA